MVTTGARWKKRDQTLMRVLCRGNEERYWKQQYSQGTSLGISRLISPPWQILLVVTRLCQDSEAPTLVSQSPTIKAMSAPVVFLGPALKAVTELGRVRK